MSPEQWRTVLVLAGIYLATQILIILSLNLYFAWR